MVPSVMKRAGKAATYAATPNTEECSAVKCTDERGAEKAAIDAGGSNNEDLSAAPASDECQDGNITSSTKKYSSLLEGYT